MCHHQVLYMICAFIALISNALCIEPFKLITCLYNEKNTERIKEYLYCLDKNLSHNLIKEVHVIYDTSNDNDNLVLLNALKSRKITIHYQRIRQTFGDCYHLANQLPLNDKVIICNADIYFNETLNLLEHIEISQRFLALTRWDVTQDGHLELFRQFTGTIFDENKSARSQDAWVLQTPIKKFENDSILLGTMGCEGAIAYEAKKSGLILLNPCLSIQACHLHLTALRTYDLRARPYANYPFEKVPWCSIETVKMIQEDVIKK